MMNDEVLIELVRKNRVLYDTSHPKYVNRTLKNNIWNNIGQVLNEDGALCRSRWNNIRDQFRKSLKKAAVKPYQVRKYKYCTQLEFLLQHLNDRETLEVGDDPTVRVKTEAAAETEDSKDCSDPEVEQDEPNDSALSPTISMRNTISPFSAQASFPMKPPSYFLDETSGHPVDAFLAGIAPTLKNLNPVSLNLAKTEIFAVVQKYELKMLTDEQDNRIGDS